MKQRNAVKNFGGKMKQVSAHLSPVNILSEGFFRKARSVDVFVERNGVKRKVPRQLVQLRTKEDHHDVVLPPESQAAIYTKVKKIMAHEGIKIRIIPTFRLLSRIDRESTLLQTKLPLATPKEVHDLSKEERHSYYYEVKRNVDALRNLGLVFPMNAFVPIHEKGKIVPILADFKHVARTKTPEEREKHEADVRAHNKKY